MVYQNRGAAFGNLGQYRRAIQDFDQAIHIDPENALAHQSRGRAFIDTSDFQRAVVDLNRAISLDASDSENYFVRGIAHANLGNPKGTIKDYKQAITLDPNNFSAIDALGLVYAQSGQIEIGIEHRERAMLNWGKPAIIEWQKYLSSTGHYSGPIHGIYDEATRTAFRACAYDKC